jgi:hypothetical protein
MDLISNEMVDAAIRRQMALARAADAPQATMESK